MCQKMIASHYRQHFKKCRVKFMAEKEKKKQQEATLLRQKERWEAREKREKKERKVEENEALISQMFYFGDDSE